MIGWEGLKKSKLLSFGMAGAATRTYRLIRPPQNTTQRLVLAVNDLVIKGGDSGNPAVTKLPKQQGRPVPDSNRQ